MSNLQDQRPGVYSSYTVTSRYATPRSVQTAALVCKGGPSLAGTLFPLTSVGQAAGLLTGDVNRTALTCCRILLESGVSKVWLSVAGTDYNPALALVEEQEGVGILVCDAATPTDLDKVKASVLRSAEKRYERVAFGGINLPELALAAAEELSCERMLLCCPAVRAEGDDTPRAVYAAAALCGYFLAKGDPVANLNGAKMEALSAADPLAEGDIQALIAGGVTVMEQVGEHVECVRAVTTRSMGGGAPDNTLRPLNTILIIDDVMKTLRAALKARLGGLRRHGGTLDAILSQVVVELRAKQDEGVIESFEAPMVRADEGDPSVTVVEIAFRAAHLIDQIHITAHVEV